MRTFAVTSVTAVALLGAVAASPLSSGQDAGRRAPLYTPPNVFGSSSQDEFGIQAVPDPDAHLIPDSYIVVLRDSHGHHLPSHLRQLGEVHARELARSSRSSGSSLFSSPTHGVAHHFDVGALKGYAGRFGQDTLDWIRRHPAVEFVERDSVVRAMDLEKGAPWGLARISHRKSLTLGTLGRYEYEHEGGEGVDVYVIDTGINIEHVEFEGRASWGKTMPQNDVDADGNGHGTHCAGTIASRKYGVAKKANVIAVKVLGSGGSGSMSDVVGGVAWAANAAASKASTEAARNGTHRGSVASMSLGGGKSAALDLAVNNSVKKGLHFSVAAGNDNRDACSYSPAAAEEAVTVGASTISDSRAYFSNFGKCVDIFAPGLNILSTWNTGNRSVNTISGTSMATPHISGLIAYYLSLYPTGAFAPTRADYEAAGVAYVEEEAAPEASFWSKGRQLIFGSGATKLMAPAPKKPLDPRVLKKSLIRLSTKDVLTQIPDDGTPNYLAFNNYTGSALAAQPEATESLDEQLVHFQPVMEKAEERFEELEEVFGHLEQEMEDVVEEFFADALAALKDD